MSPSAWRGAAYPCICPPPERRHMGDILSKYDVLGAFGTTIYLAAFSALGLLLIGTLVAIMRVSPVKVLQTLGAWYVNIIRNIPLTLIMVFSILGALYI